ncbi:MAG: hypothetical protein GC171_02920 [Terrimonas sp.]|nr:hypothetical protein [Terrimonas sp.]
MKKIIILVFILVSCTAHSQKLKDLLYSGKMKTDSGTVVKKDDDLSAKIDTSKKRVQDSVKIMLTKSASPSLDSNLKTDRNSLSTNDAGAEVTKSVPADNNVIWKNYMDEVTKDLTTEVLPNKKIRNGTYYILVEYEIGPDGDVTINNVFPSPDNSFLQQQVKDKLTLTAPRMNPVIGSNGKARKAVKKYNFSLTK